MSLWRSNNQRHSNARSSPKFGTLSNPQGLILSAIRRCRNLWCGLLSLKIRISPFLSFKKCHGNTYMGYFREPPIHSISPLYSRKDEENEISRRRSETSVYTGRGECGSTSRGYWVDLCCWSCCYWRSCWCSISSKAKRQDLTGNKSLKFELVISIKFKWDGS